MSGLLFKNITSALAVNFHALVKKNYISSFIFIVFNENPNKDQFFRCGKSLRIINLNPDNGL